MTRATRAAAALLGLLAWAGPVAARGGAADDAPRRTVRRALSDDMILGKVKAKLASADNVPAHRIDVKVRRGVVTLTGVVESSEQIKGAVAAAETIKGVKEVKNNLFIAR
jgi:hyperosmotically inducible periplasmic protein